MGYQNPLQWFYALTPPYSKQEVRPMPLPVTPYFEQRLATLRTLSPEVAALAEAIAAALTPEVLKESADAQSQRLFDRMYEVARQDVACALRLAAWPRRYA